MHELVTWMSTGWFAIGWFLCFLHYVRVANTSYKGL